MLLALVNARARVQRQGLPMTRQPVAGRQPVVSLGVMRAAPKEAADGCCSLPLHSSTLPLSHTEAFHQGPFECKAAAAAIGTLDHLGQQLMELERDIMEGGSSKVRETAAWL